ncbi:MAG: glycosyltransferase family 2 protein [Flavobacteriales bacterium]|nr:glycosyltransferase family 2 protein [Flavobacteriales bacterium]
MNPSVSVIIPNFDRADLLVHAVRSCLDQTYPVAEVLVCDDGSSDDSEARINALSDPRVKWLPGPHAGRPAVPRNRGIAAATGAWLAFLDSDDAWVPGKLAIQFAHLAVTHAGASCSNALRVIPGSGSQDPYFNTPAATLSLGDLLALNRVICSSALVRKDHVVNAGGFPEEPEMKALEDYALWLRICAFTSFDYCAETLVRYTDAPASSVRAAYTDGSLVREAALSNLWAWSQRNTQAFSSTQRAAIARHLRASKRTAGRPPWDWLFIR